MRENGKAIYNCDYAGLKKQDWGYYTKVPGSAKVNLVVCNVPVSCRLKVVLPKGMQIREVTDVSGKKMLVEQLNNTTFEVLLQSDDVKWGMPFVLEMKLERMQNKKGKFVEMKALT